MAASPSFGLEHRLPGFLRASRISARVWAAGAVGIGAAVAAYAGLYPQFDGGRLRLALAVTCGPFGAAVVAYALSGKTWGRAFWRALSMSAILGVAATVLPGILIAKGDVQMLGVVLMFGTFFGAPTGAVYGLPIAVLAAMAQRSVVQTSHASNDRAARLAAVWLVLASSCAAAGTWFFDVKRYLVYSEEMGMAWTDLIPFVVAIATLVVGLALVVRASVRLRRRARWIARVQAGGEASFRVRPIDVRDDVDGLPRLGHGADTAERGAPDRSLVVVEWVGVSEQTTAYRMQPMGTPIALVPIDERLLVA